MKNILTIMKKELDRVFKDPKLIFSVFILPGLLIFILYSIMGQAFSSMYTTEEFKVHLVNAPTEVVVNLEQLSESADINFIVNTNNLEASEVDDLLNNKELDLSVVFNDTNQIAITYKSVNMSSYNALSFFISSLASYQDNSYIINGETYQLSATNDITTPDELEDENSRQVTAILPMLLMTFLFTGALSFGPESIAGDKERGTISTLLASPVKRSEIALGKIFSLSILSVLAGLSSFIGVILSLPALMGGLETSLTYQLIDYIGILVLLVSAVLLIISVVSIISAYARTVKEATSYSSPFMILSMVIGLSNLFVTGTPGQLTGFIPLYNIVQSLNMILSFNFDITYFLLTIGSNLIVTILLAFVLTKQFQSERIMFAK